MAVYDNRQFFFSTLLRVVFDCESYASYDDNPPASVQNQFVPPRPAFVQSVTTPTPVTPTPSPVTPTSTDHIYSAVSYGMFLLICILSFICKLIDYLFDFNRTESN